MSDPELFVVIPTYGHFDFAAKAVRTCFEHTPDVFVLLMDDASLDINGVAPSEIAELLKEHQDRMAWAGFRYHGGLTRSWNHALELARNDSKPKYVCLANSDVLFTPGWSEPLIRALNNDYDLIGPLTNAPGPCVTQDVRTHIRTYQPSDQPDALASWAQELKTVFYNSTVEAEINGFCMLAKLSTWWKFAYDSEHVFRPSNPINSKCQPNPTPTMTLNECEFQGRLRARGGKAGVALGSYVFHYRSISRGDKYAGKQAYRPSQETQP